MTPPAPPPADASSADPDRTRPALPFPFEESDLPPRRHRRWPWLVAFAIVLLLIVAAFFAGEWIARDLVTKAITQQLAARLDISSDTEIDVDIPGSILLQAATGRIEEATVSSPEVSVGDLSGQVSVTVDDIGIWDGGSISGGRATLSLDSAQAQALLSQVDGFPADTLGLSDPDVTVSTTVSVLGTSVPVGVALTPSADDGDVLLTPASVTLGGAEVTADDLRSRFGTLADTVLQTWRVCVAQELPAGMPLTAVSVTGDRLVADFDIAAGSLTDAALQEKGTC
ncbi:MAG: DUF2993 domain-containing protein [Microbacterium sp.]